MSSKTVSFRGEPARSDGENPESYFVLQSITWDSGSIFFRFAKRKLSGMTVLVGSLVLFLALLFPFAAYAVVPTVEKPIAILRALDKITARVEELDVPIGRPYKFGTLIITVRGCRVTPPEETPEAAAFIEVNEFKPGEQGAQVFRGWMFASSPALSAMEHPVYDIWVTGCKDVEGVAPSTSPASASPQTAPAPRAAPQTAPAEATPPAVPAPAKPAQSPPAN
jgi:hypothetical protein